MIGDGGVEGSGSHPPRVQDDVNSNIIDMLENLNLTEEEGEFAVFSDDEGEGEMATVEWAWLGKMLSFTVLHVSTITRAMKPAWGNPFGLKIRSIRERNANLFVAQFRCKEDKEGS
jgi:hypothetical protein